MKDRRGIYMAALIIMASLVYFGCDDSKTGSQSSNQVQTPVTAESRPGFENATITASTKPIDKQIIFDDFKDMADIEVPDGVLGGTFFLSRLYLPAGYSGAAGEDFYASLEDGHIAVLQHYQIVNTPDGTLKYELVETIENSDSPSGDYEAYTLRKDEWQKVQ